ncbi:MAG: CDP-diacylglycerol--serine O-phosphatidyltransferase [Deltaproteobacteria bacterium]|nr:CDP-diacylglycerol--serine O-phosphatidyltransferase [Deltaproteobacteria bacterium]MBW2075955.1 CDP-diacylglycerol--serine O-phosphatidyltransferase [Deltaproteobacteria bacterium]RLB31586.1 MAG: CDP-diacylglycerol--serine O-phosphatidyltransferase [Deltaproteobacteria bacterium]
MKVNKSTRSTPRNKRGIYILPNLFTSCSLFGGFYAIIAAIQGRFEAAAIAILISSIFDGLDGKIARFTNTTSKFGAEYDSLSDLVAFGVAPGLLAFEWSLEPFGRLGLLAVFLYIICGALRLARFNIQKATLESRHFKGLPIPGAAIFIATFVLFINSMGGIARNQYGIIIGIVYLLSFLMVSTIDYVSFKGLGLFKRKPFNALVATILLFIVVASKPALMLFLFSIMYVVSGPAMMLYHVVRRSPKTARLSADSSSEKAEDGAIQEL